MRFGVSGGKVTCGGGGGAEVGEIEGFLLATHICSSGEVRPAFDSDFAAGPRWEARREKGARKPLKP
jgi:hypothetical protein